MSAHKPSFIVSSSVVAALAVFGLLLSGYRNQIPVQAQNAMLQERADYLRQGGNQNLDWHPLGAQALTLAKRLERPIMLVIGTAWSRDGRLADHVLFIDQDVQLFLNRNFVCVRVDIDERPVWANAILPLSRVELNTGPAFQIAFLDPRGKVFDHMGRYGIPFSDPHVFLTQLINVLARYNQEQANTIDAPDFQANDVSVLNSDQEAPPNLDDYLDSLRATVDRKNGSFTKPLGARLRATAWNFLLANDQIDDFKASFAPITQGSVIDWLDGGFFRGSRRPDWLLPEYDKPSILNIDMAVTMAVAATKTGDRLYRILADRTLVSLTSEFVREDGLIATARLGDEDGRGRSSRSSFRYPEVQPLWGSRFLSRDESRWAAANLRLSPQRNPSMSIAVANLSIFDDPNFDLIVAKLRNARTEIPAHWTTMEEATSNGRVCAGLFRCARLLKDDDLESKARDAFDRARLAFLYEDDVSHFPKGTWPSRPGLGDYLAMSDACLEAFCSTGNINDFEQGRKILLRARTLFRSNRPGVWKTGVLDADEQITLGITGPEILDNFTESLTAQMMRLTNSYALLSGETFAKRPYPNAHLMEEALGARTHFGPIAQRLGAFSAGFMLADLAITARRAALCLGPDSHESASALQQAAPFALVAPVDSLELKLPSKGIYIVDTGSLYGPLTLDQAKSAISGGTLPAEKAIGS